MNSKYILVGLMTLIIGGGFGYSIGRSSAPFATGERIMVTNPPIAPQNKQETMPEMTMSLGEKDAEFDLRFIEAMIKHHEGALDMAKQAQYESDREEVKSLANDVIEAQTKEINQLKQWKTEWYSTE